MDDKVDDDKAQRIAALNDLFRRDFFIPSFGPRPAPGHILCTSGISAVHGELLNWPKSGVCSGFDTMPGCAMSFARQSGSASGKLHLVFRLAALRSGGH